MQKKEISAGAIIYQIKNFRHIHLKLVFLSSTPQTEEYKKRVF